MKTIARTLRRIADWIDPSGQIFYASPYALAIEEGRGLVVREDGTGCPIAYVGRDHDRMDEAPAAVPPAHLAGRPVSRKVSGQ